MELDQVLTVLAAFGTGTIVSTYVGNVGGRRGARAEVIRALSDVETARWYDPADPDAPPLGPAVRVLQGSALVAGVPRTLLDSYVRQARIARSMGQRNYDIRGGVEPSDAGINADYADQVQALAILVRDCCWHPWLTWLSRPDRQKAVEKKITEIGDEDEEVQRALGHRFGV